MIGQAGRKRRTSILIAIIVLAMVCAFWVVFLPRTKFYRTYRSERGIETMMRSLQPPPHETAPMNVHTFHLGDATVGVGVFVTTLPFDNVKAHYRTEFTRHGFIYTGETTSGSQVSLHFCAKGYAADLGGDSATPAPSSPAARKKNLQNLQTYTIMVVERSTPC